MLDAAEGSRECWTAEHDEFRGRAPQRFDHANQTGLVAGAIYVVDAILDHHQIGPQVPRRLEPLLVVAVRVAVPRLGFFGRRTADAHVEIDNRGAPLDRSLELPVDADSYMAVDKRDAGHGVRSQAARRVVELQAIARFAVWRIEFLRYGSALGGERRSVAH